MKNIIISFLFFSISVFAQDFPTAGNTFIVKYNPSEKNIFTNESRLTLVYAFDEWGSKFIYFHGKGLFKNVLDPDEGQKREAIMSFDGSLFIAEIFIPNSAQLLSYYISDGNNFDYNDEKTYVSYVYGINQKPVKGARFRNVDFLIMAGADPVEYIAELENEVADYTDYHLARAVLWGKKLETSKSFEEIIFVKDEFEKAFNELRINYPDDYEFMNAEARVYNSFMTAITNVARPYYKFGNEKILEIAEQIPDGKRSSTVERIYQSHLQQQKYEKLKEDIIGKPAINFELTTITGEKKNLSDYKGKIVLLDFWGTWCGPCVGEIPNMIKVYNKYKDKGFEIISISSDLMMKSKTEEEFKKFISEKNMEWVHALDDINKTVHNLYNISHWPTLFLIDKNGNVIKNEDVLRGSSLEQTLEEVFSSNL